MGMGMGVTSHPLLLILCIAAIACLSNFNTCTKNECLDHNYPGYGHLYAMKKGFKITAKPVTRGAITNGAAPGAPALARKNIQRLLRSRMAADKTTQVNR